MSTCVDKVSHNSNDCKSGDGVQVFEKDDGSVDGFCFACDTYIENPYGQPKRSGDLKKTKVTTKSKEDIESEMEDIAKLSSVDLKSRRLRGKALSYFGVKVGFSTSDGETPNLVFFPYTESNSIVKYKVRLLNPKKMWSVGVSNNVDLFGWSQALKTGAKRLIITEGEFDAVALHTIIETHTKDSYKEYKPAVCSLPNGAGNARRDLVRLLPEIKRHFKEVSFSFDGDGPGLKAMKECCILFPEATVVNLPAKDANACILEGKAKSTYNSLTFNKDKPKNTNLVWGSDLHDKAKTPPVWGLSWPWPTMTRKTRGIRFGETIYIGAGEKMGKSEIVNALGKHLAVDHNLKIMLAKPEESNNKTYKMMASKVVGKFFHDPSVEFDEGAYEIGGAKIRDNICLLNLYQNLTWDVLKADIHSAVGQGVKAVFLDPITNLTNGLSSSAINEVLQGVSQDLAALAKDLDIVIFIFCHLNKPGKGYTPWDRGGKITTDYFAGSSAMARSCNYAIGLEGNRDPELDSQEQNMRDLVILADREFGESGKCKLYWDDKTGLFSEVES